MQRQRVPSLIFCVGSSASLTSAVSYQTLDAEDSRPSSLRGLGRGFGLVLGMDDALMSNTAPRLPKRLSSRGMGLRKLSSSFHIDHQESMRNATFSPKASGKKKLHSPVNRFGCFVRPMLGSPALTQASRKTRTSECSSDTPLTVPQRKSSEQSCMSPLSPNSPRTIKAFTVLSGLQNAKFGDLLNTSSHSSKSNNTTQRLPARPVQTRRFNNNHVRM
ncbi:unnamed protein product [Cylindrotheca closterium]|uniref:Uncharacterized protein n=1 Tax=Cylindrotheca closterium TaxID=2856 RepID=A0AAD2G3C6_9STRA|nr:unnamed protein product [Cylindrotheca closterium]